MVAALTAWGLGGAGQLAQLQNALAALVAKLPDQDGGQLVSFTVPGQSAAYQHTLSLGELIAAYTEAIQRAQGQVGIVRRTSSYFW